MIRQRTQPSPRMGDRSQHWLWLGPLLYMILVGLYLIVRFHGRWAENDSATFTSIIQAFVDQGQLVPRQIFYANGYAYSALSTFIIGLTGLEPTTLQQLIYPPLAALVVLPAWLLYREFTGSARGATLTTVLLLTQPEFLFVILRSSHEKFTRALMLLCLFWLVRSLRLQERPRSFGVYVGLFYLTAFAFVASNNLLAHSFIFAVATALMIGRLLELRRPILRQQNSLIRGRLHYIALACLTLVYIFTFHIYAPAQHDLSVLKDMGDQISALFLDVESESTNAYVPVISGWISLRVYFILSIANWLILAVSFAIWAWRGIRWYLRGQAPESREAWLLWLFYTAFMVQGALSVVADTSGAIASNLQHRLFPSFSIFSVGLVGSALMQWRPRRFARPIQLGLAGCILSFAILSALKATNEPAFSNMWMFYGADELTALEWSKTHMSDGQLWTDFNERLVVASLMAGGDSTTANRLVGFGMRAEARDVLSTNITRLRSSRIKQPLPIPPDALQVYDNGDSQIYHLRPETPFQR
jgi:hypothetical protein